MLYRDLGWWGKVLGAELVQGCGARCRGHFPHLHPMLHLIVLLAQPRCMWFGFLIITSLADGFTLLEFEGVECGEGGEGCVVIFTLTFGSLFWSE